MNVRIRFADGTVRTAEIPPGCQRNAREATAWLGHDAAYRVRLDNPKSTYWRVLGRAR